MVPVLPARITRDLVTRGVEILVRTRWPDFEYRRRRIERSIAHEATFREDGSDADIQGHRFRVVPAPTALPLQQVHQ